MIIGDDIAARIDDESGAQGHAGDLRASGASTVALVEETAQQLVEHRWRDAAQGDLIFNAAGPRVSGGVAHSLDRRDIDNCGHDLLYDRRKTWRRAAARRVKPICLSTAHNRCD